MAFSEKTVIWKVIMFETNVRNIRMLALFALIVGCVIGMNSNASHAQSLLQGYGKEKHSMKCNLGKGFKKVSVKDDKIFIGNTKLPIIEKDGKTFASKIGAMGGIIFIFDFKKRVMVRKMIAANTEEEFNCI